MISAPEDANIYLSKPLESKNSSGFVNIKTQMSNEQFQEQLPNMNNNNFIDYLPNTFDLNVTNDHTTIVEMLNSLGNKRVITLTTAHNFDSASKDAFLGYFDGETKQRMKNLLDQTNDSTIHIIHNKKGKATFLRITPQPDGKLKIADYEFYIEKNDLVRWLHDSK